MPDYLNSTHRTIAWLKKVHDDDCLEMKPPFQRNPVWSNAQKSYLMDSILHGFPIPELYMQEEVDEQGGERHVVVDGQQRTRACLEFIDGEFAIDADQSTKWGGLVFDDLSPDDKKRFFGYQFVVRKLPVVDDAQIREIFQRLNRNVIALNDQELRHATYGGSFIRLMEEIADMDYWEGTGLFTPNAVRRMLDVEFISELTIAALHGPQNKKLTLDRWYATYEGQFDEHDDVKSLFAAVLGELHQSLPGIRETRWRKRSDFYTLFCVIGNHRKSIPLSKTGRSRLGKLLSLFGLSVDSYIAAEKAQDEKAMSSIAPAIKTYAVNVQRAASDLGSRKNRAEVLDEYLKTVWS
ncbi:MAG: DUF262 domain-containing protein [Phycisphaeraceae bacterium]|nr:DUF262 domain-containing protein [Phycisphaeraceae bacterium]